MGDLGVVVHVGAGTAVWVLRSMSSVLAGNRPDDVNVLRVLVSCGSGLFSGILAPYPDISQCLLFFGDLDTTGPAPRVGSD